MPIIRHSKGFRERGRTGLGCRVQFAESGMASYGRSKVQDASRDCVIMNQKQKGVDSTMPTGRTEKWGGGEEREDEEASGGLADEGGWYRDREEGKEGGANMFARMGGMQRGAIYFFVNPACFIVPKAWRIILRDRAPVERSVRAFRKSSTVVKD